ncbi:MAG TPA: hypothetical protein VJK72_03460 [Candidatus Nanoarchaeia archaeon]|nr:hypothetical protein [Candidatus Nanoarchaeia archaeon]
MKLLILLLVVIFIVACTPTVSELPPVQIEPTEEPQQPDDYLNIQTAEDDFNAIEETLDLLP